MNKFRLLELSPYKKTMFIDADCLLVKNDIDSYWQRASGSFFAITGHKRQSGWWKGRTIQSIIADQRADYLVQMNGGVFYFDKSRKSQAFFRDLNAFYHDRKESLRVHTHNGTRHYSDELFLGVFLGLRHMEPIALEGRDAWMVSTWRALYCDFHPGTGVSILVKPAGYLFGSTALPLGWRRWSPTFAHFVSLKPRQLYVELARQFRAAAASIVMTPPSISRQASLEYAMVPC
ncbi:MAG: hypothetical protein JO227_14135 [Acetobacteraceae bacterium]|nr:hypothetical protein [Acetobacteraceae bacterium]